MSIKKDYISILLTAAVWLMSACASDDFEAPTPAATGNEPETVTADKEPADREVQLKAYSSPFKENRVYAPSAPAGFSPFTPDKATAILRSYRIRLIRSMAICPKREIWAAC